MNDSSLAGTILGESAELMTVFPVNFISSSPPYAEQSVFSQVVSTLGQPAESSLTHAENMSQPSPPSSLHLTDDVVVSAISYLNNDYNVHLRHSPSKPALNVLVGSSCFRSIQQH